MRITNSNREHTSNLAKCTKMTEGEHRIHGMNGVSDNGNGNINAVAVNLNVKVKEEKNDGDGDGEAVAAVVGTPDTYSHLGGRLKFFKNGRFILELARAREGEKVAWVPVPKKTFWPPPGSTSSLSTYRQESSTSLSVSDDNSSIQSSPWQRDHTWKQTSPQRNISSNLNLYFIKNNKQQQGNVARRTCWQYKLQRAPYLIITEQQRTKCSIKNNKCNNSKCFNNNSKSKSNNSNCAIMNHQRKTLLVHVVEFLWNKSLQTLNSITSPRKRILRELERVTIDDDLSIYNKRCRGKVTTNQQPSKIPQSQQHSNVSTSNNNNNETFHNITLVQNNRLELNDCEEYNQHHQQQQQQRSIITTTGQFVGNKNCSYSITSLLGDENKIEKSSSSTIAITTATTTTASATVSNQYITRCKSNSPSSSPSVSSNYTVDVPNGPSNKNTKCNNNKRSPIPGGRSPDSTHFNYHLSHSTTSPTPSSFISPYPMYSSVLHHQHSLAAVAAAANYINPYYHHHHHHQHQHQHQQHQNAAAAYATFRPSTFYHQPLISQPIGPRHEPQYSSTWNTYEQQQHHHFQGGALLHKDDTSDVPLNLSKHAD